MTAGNTYHCVCTKTGSTVKLYINGSDVTGSVSNQTFTDNAHPLLVGVFNFNGSAFAGTYYDGIIDEVAIYNVALSAATVTAHYTAGTVAESVRMLASLGVGT